MDMEAMTIQRSTMPEKGGGQNFLSGFAIFFRWKMKERTTMVWTRGDVLFCRCKMPSYECLDFI